MKKIIIAIALSFMVINLYSQNIVDPPKLSNFNTINTNIYDINFNKDSFLLGWNWGSAGLALDQALNMNYYHQNSFLKKVYNKISFF
jgi:hypothetical protein